MSTRTWIVAFAADAIAAALVVYDLATGGPTALTAIGIGIFVLGGLAMAVVLAIASSRSASDPGVDDDPSAPSQSPIDFH